MIGKCKRIFQRVKNVCDLFHNHEMNIPEIRKCINIFIVFVQYIIIYLHYMPSNALWHHECYKLPNLRMKIIILALNWRGLFVYLGVRSQADLELTSSCFSLLNAGILACKTGRPKELLYHCSLWIREALCGKQNADLIRQNDSKPC